MNDNDCDRCGVKTNMFTGSYFNTQTICIDCSMEERAHPRFKEAQDADQAAVMNGNFNFKGIGCPPELLDKARAREASR
jgi:hypothetical protein